MSHGQCDLTSPARVGPDLLLSGLKAAETADDPQISPRRWREGAGRGLGGVKEGVAVVRDHSPTHPWWCKIVEWNGGRGGACFAVADCWRSFGVCFIGWVREKRLNDGLHLLSSGILRCTCAKPGYYCAVPRHLASCVVDLSLIYNLDLHYSDRPRATGLKGTTSKKSGKEDRCEFMERRPGGGGGGGGVAQPLLEPTPAAHTGMPLRIAVPLA